MLQLKRKSETDLNSLAIATAKALPNRAWLRQLSYNFLPHNVSRKKENSPKSGDLMETTVSVSCSGLVSLDSAVLGGRVEE